MTFSPSSYLYKLLLVSTFPVSLSERDLWNSLAIYFNKVRSMHPVILRSMLHRQPVDVGSASSFIVSGTSLYSLFLASIFPASFSERKACGIAYIFLQSMFDSPY